MGNVVKTTMPHLEAIGWPLPWGPVIRGFRCEGSPDAVFLLHEPGSDLDAWKTLPVQLAGQLGMATVALDLPGHGLSDDPWEPARLPDLLRALTRIAPEARRRFVITAGAPSLVALTLATDLGLAGLVSLSPEAPGVEWSPHRSPAVPKLFVAGSTAGKDLGIARRLASISGGWTVVTSLPVAARGTALVASAWAGRLNEEIIAFLRDCQRPQRRQPRPAGDVIPIPRASTLTSADAGQESSVGEVLPLSPDVPSPSPG